MLYVPSFHHLYDLPARGCVHQRVAAGGLGPLLPRAVVAAGVVAVHHLVVAKLVMVLRLQSIYEKYLRK